MDNFSILKEFDLYNRSKGLAEPTIHIQGDQMRLFEKQVKKPFKDVTRCDIEQFLNWMHENGQWKTTLFQGNDRTPKASTKEIL